MSLSVMAEKLYSRFILCFSNVSFLLLGFTIFGKFTTRAEFQSITRSGNKTVDETRDPMSVLEPRIDNRTRLLDHWSQDQTKPSYLVTDKVFNTVSRFLNKPIYYSNQFWSGLFVFLTFHGRFKCNKLLVSY